MSWQQGRLVTLQEILESATSVLPSRFQIADPVWVWVNEEHGFERPIEGVIVGASFGLLGRMSYSIAFRIGTGPYYAVATGVRGWLTSPGESLSPEDGLVEVTKIEGAVRSVKAVERRASMRIVPPPGTPPEPEEPD